jgi:hypothetical protein
MQNFDHNIGFWEKRQFFRRKLSKIAENCDHNIDPWDRCWDFLWHFRRKYVYAILKIYFFPREEKLWNCFIQLPHIWVFGSGRRFWQVFKCSK